VVVPPGIKLLCELDHAAREGLRAAADDHLQPMYVAAMAEVVAEEHVTAAANDRFGDQDIKPAGLLLVTQLISVEHETLNGGDHLKATERVQQVTNLRRGGDGRSFRQTAERNSIST